MSLTDASSLAPSWHDLTYRDLERALVSSAVPAVHARPLWRTLHRQAATPWTDRASLPAPVQRWLDDVTESGRLRWKLPEVEAETASSDGLTRKFLLRMADGQTIETVLMSYRDRHTACVSTQAGCAMGCVFCA